jgi:hypothetical protein
MYNLYENWGGNNCQNPDVIQDNINKYHPPDFKYFATDAEAKAYFKLCHKNIWHTLSMANKVGNEAAI